MWSSAWPASNSAVWTGRPVSASNVTAPTNSGRRARQHDVDLGARLREQPGEPRRLVARDPAGDAEQDAAAVEGRRRRSRARRPGRTLGAAASLGRRRRGTTRYSISPFDSSSSERVVSFFSRDDERSRGNSFSTRAYFAATSTPRYLLAACFGDLDRGEDSHVFSSIRVWSSSICRSSSLDERRDLLRQAAGSRSRLTTSASMIDDDLRDGALEIVVDDHVLVPSTARSSSRADCSRAASCRRTLGLPRSQPLEQHLGRRRQHEDQHRLRETRARTAARPARRCPSRRAARSPSTRSHFAPQRAVQVAVHLRRFGELPAARASRRTPRDVRK